MTYPIPCATSPFNWPTDNRVSYEDVSAICNVSADLILFVDRGQPLGAAPEYISERVELVNFVLAELTKGRRPQSIRNKLFNRWLRARDAQERQQKQAEWRATQQRLDELTEYGRKMGWLPPAQSKAKSKSPSLTAIECQALLAHLEATGFLARYDDWARERGLLTMGAGR